MAAFLDALAGWWSNWIWPILLFVVGLGAMVFVHELGHFLVAKLVGIKVERFAIGMGPRLLGLRRGETDYCLRLLPLGGYVKMLGQEDFGPIRDDEQVDPRSYRAKSVSRRFAVISAGVIMNVILAAGLFVVVGLVGNDFVAPVVGDTVPGYPADVAEVQWQGAGADVPAGTMGLKPGWRITRIDGDSLVLWICGNKVEHFADVALIALLADPSDTYTLTVERQADGRTWVGKARLQGQAGEEGVRFGIEPPADLVFVETKSLIDSRYRPDDRVLSVAGRAVQHSWQVRDIEEALTGEPVTVTVRREGKPVAVQVRPVLQNDGRRFRPLKDGTLVRGRIVGSRRTQVERVLPSGQTEKRPVRQYTIELGDGSRRELLSDELDANGLWILGMVPRQRVLLVSRGSPAHEAGVRPGDIVLGYGPEPTPTPEQVLELSKRLRDGGATLTVLRDGKTQKLQVVPEEQGKQYLIGIAQLPDLEHPVVAFVRKGSPADKAGIPAEATITAVNGRPIRTWYDVYDALKAASGQRVAIEYRLGETTGTAEIAELSEELFAAEDYRFSVFPGDLPFRALEVKIRQDGLLASLAWGGRVTVKLVLSSYLSIRSLIRGWAPLSGAAGPIGIGTIAVHAGRRSFMDLLYFLGFISAAIAVFNFLPLPVLDGGHAVLLLIEKIRGRALSARVMNIIQYAGLALLLGLFVLITWNDIMRLL